jgi:iron(III) transport system substrate-binding protein
MAREARRTRGRWVARSSRAMPALLRYSQERAEVDSMIRAWRWGFVGLAVLASLAVLAPATAQPLTTAQTGRFTGPDRLARLIAGAKREGSVTVYSSIPLVTMTEITGAFEKRYGIEVELYRAESTQLLQRAVNEARTGRNSVDVIESAGAEVEAMERERLLQEVSLPVFADLLPGSTKAGRAWVASRLTVFVAAYNTNLIRAADAPKSYEDLLQPKFRGRIGIEAENGNWLMAMSQLRGEQNVTRLFRDMVARNGMSFRRGHSLLVNLVASGEVPVGLNVYNEHVIQAKERGAPIEIVYMAPNIAQPLGLAVFRRAPHPHAAVLFQEFMLSEAQRIIAAQQMFSTNVKLNPLPKDMQLHILDAARFVDEDDKWIGLYRQIFGGRAG